MSEPTSRRAAQPQGAEFMEHALRQAEIAVTRGQTPFGPVVVDRDGRAIGEATTPCAPIARTAKLVAIRDA